jgi:hypothetical protein
MWRRKVKRKRQHANTRCARERENSSVVPATGKTSPLTIASGGLQEKVEHHMRWVVPYRLIRTSTGSRQKRIDELKQETLPIAFEMKILSGEREREREEIVSMHENTRRFHSKVRIENPT